MGHVWTARIDCQDPDVFDVTFRSGSRIFAPTWTIFKPMLAIRRSGRVATDEEWRTYGRAYLQQMALSHKLQPEAWEALLARPRVVLTCYCTDPRRCHRTLLGLFLGRLGATFNGELPDRDPYQEQLFDLAQDLT